MSGRLEERTQRTFGVRDEAQTVVERLAINLSYRVNASDNAEAHRQSTIMVHALNEAAESYISDVESGRIRRLPVPRLTEFLLNTAADLATIYPTLTDEEWSPTSSLSGELPDRNQYAESYYSTSALLSNYLTSYRVSENVRSVSSRLEDAAIAIIPNALERREVLALISATLTEAMGNIGGLTIDSSNSVRIRVTLINEARTLLDNLRSGTVSPEDVRSGSVPDPQSNEDMYIRAITLLGVVERGLHGESVEPSRRGDFHAGASDVMDQSVMFTGAHIHDVQMQENVMFYIEQALGRAERDLSESGDERVSQADARSRLIDRAIELLSAQRDNLERAREGPAGHRIRGDPEQVQSAINVLTQVRRGTDEFDDARPQLRR